MGICLVCNPTMVPSTKTDPRNGGCVHSTSLFTNPKKGTLKARPIYAVLKSPLEDGAWVPGSQQTPGSREDLVMVI